jgi:hypothetical protein
MACIDKVSGAKAPRNGVPMLGNRETNRMPYYAVLACRKGSTSFLELPVVKKKKVGTVTVPTLGAVTEVFPSGVRVEGVGMEMLKAVLSALGHGQ